MKSRFRRLIKKIVVRHILRTELKIGIPGGIRRHLLIPHHQKRRAFYQNIQVLSARLGFGIQVTEVQTRLIRIVLRFHAALQVFRI